MLAAARRHYESQQRINALALREARRHEDRGTLAQSLVALQRVAVGLTLASTDAELAEQGLRAPAVADVAVAALVTPTRDIAAMLGATADQVGAERLALTLVQDAGRTAATVDILRRPAVTGWVRSLNLPSCSRCAILAGRVYRYSTGFQRHPLCDCLMTPTTLAAGQELTLDPTDAIRDGQIRGLTRAEMEALDAGADLGQVVNARRRKAGLRVGSSVIERGGRLTPQGIQHLATGRAHAIELLRRHGYITR